ncbi:surfeit locus protein 6-like [Meles meles]|uniref:surfeit locus protein 6-like n=1 Tax=Meles meles TaxID=9662 RepID=UPI001E69A580|nr:surfeit locus protein 6-like [Meles meles]
MHLYTLPSSKPRVMQVVLCGRCAGVDLQRGAVVADPRDRVLAGACAFRDEVVTDKEDEPYWLNGANDRNSASQLTLLSQHFGVWEADGASKAQHRKEKRRKLKGNLAPLTGRNYRQLLERLQVRQAQLEELRGRDEGKARELESKTQWTNLLYKAESVRIRDDEHRLQEALRRKEKRRAQGQRRWEKRTAHVVEKMQRRQDKRRQNLRKKRAARAQRRLHKARRKGRILPQDLERAGLA